MSEQPDSQDQVLGALDVESDLADRLPAGHASQVRFDALLEAAREQPLGARVHEADLAGVVHDHDRLGEIFHQRSEVGGSFRRRLRRLVVSAFFGVHIGSAKEDHGLRRCLFRTMRIARCQSRAQESVAPVAEESACAASALNRHNSCYAGRLRNSRRDALASEARYERQFLKFRGNPWKKVGMLGNYIVWTGSARERMHPGTSAAETCTLCPSEAESASPRKRERGDEAAFHELVDRYANEMYRLAVSLVGNATDAEDVVQETFSGAFQAMPDFEGRSSVRTWLSRILVKQAAKWRRRRKVRRTVVLDATAPGPSPEPGLRIDVLGTLETLSPEHREVIALREFQGMSYEEIAEVLGVPRGTVESRLFRARQELRDRLKAYLP